MVRTLRSVSEALRERETMPIMVLPLRTSAMPREDPPIWTSTRHPGFWRSNCLPISLTSGATVLDPVSVMRWPAPRPQAPASHNIANAVAQPMAGNVLQRNEKDVVASFKSRWA